MAICPHCGRTVPDDALICPYCGAQISEDIAVCGNCGHIIPVDAKVCPYCGVELSDKVICPNCGKEIPADSISCPYCGYRFDKEHLLVKSSVPYTTITTSTMKNDKPSKSPKPPKKLGFWKGFAVGFVIALLIGALLGYYYVIPLQKENALLKNKNSKLQEQIYNLQQMYDTLISQYQNLSLKYNNLLSNYQSLENKYEDLNASYEKLLQKYNALVINYTKLNKSYIQKVREYNFLLANYTALLSQYNNLSQEYSELSDKYKTLTDFSNEKFIVILYFQTGYNSFWHRYWLYLEIDPSLYIHYKLMKHYPGTLGYMDKFVNYIVTDEVMKTIVSAVKSKLTSSSPEEFADALLSIVQNKNGNMDSPGIYTGIGGDNIGTMYYQDLPAKYAVETLIIGGGECLDDSIFYGSLLKTAGFHGALLLLPNVSHAMIGVKLNSPPSHNTQAPSYWYYEVNGVKYYTAETTGYGWRVGDCPPMAQHQWAYIFTF